MGFLSKLFGKKKKKGAAPAPQSQPTFGAWSKASSPDDLAHNQRMQTYIPPNGTITGGGKMQDPASLEHNQRMQTYIPPNGTILSSSPMQDEASRLHKERMTGGGANVQGEILKSVLAQPRTAMPGQLGDRQGFVQQGPTSLLASNNAVKKEKERQQEAGEESKPRLNSAGYQGFSLRGEGKMRTGDRTFVGDLMGDAPDKMLDMSKQLKASGFDLKQGKTSQIDKGETSRVAAKFVDGVGIDEGTSEALKMYSQILNSPQGIEYMKEFQKQFGSADIFGGSQQEMAEFMFQTFQNNQPIGQSASREQREVNTRYSEVRDKKKPYTTAGKKVPKEILEQEQAGEAELAEITKHVQYLQDIQKNLGGVLAAARLQKEEQNEGDILNPLTDSKKALIQQYNALIQQLMGSLNGGESGQQGGTPAQPTSPTMQAPPMPTSSPPSMLQQTGAPPLPKTPPPAIKPKFAPPMPPMSPMSMEDEYGA